MKYIAYKNNKVLYILDKAPIGVSEGVEVARCDYIPPLNTGEYHEVYNVQEHIETYTEKEPREVIKVDEVNGEEYPDIEYVEVEKQRPYKTCELRVKVDEKAVKIIRLRKLKTWFDNDYREAFEKFTRWKAMEIFEVVTDKVFNIDYASLEALYRQAEIVRGEIKSLEVELGVK